MAEVMGALRSAILRSLDAWPKKREPESAAGQESEGASLLRPTIARQNCETKINSAYAPLRQASFGTHTQPV